MTQKQIDSLSLLQRMQAPTPGFSLHLLCNILKSAQAFKI